MQTIIAISKGSGEEKYLNYARWLRYLEPDVVCKDLSLLDPGEAMQALQKSSGLLLTGGHDVHPARYNRQEMLGMCDCDLERDKREWEYIDAALEQNKPMLGICRGMQLLNVYFGGTLIVDLSSSGYVQTVHKAMEGDAEHNLTVHHPAFQKIVNTSTGMINSRHHQAVDAIASPFTAYAESPDGLVEAMGNTDASLPFSLAVQWHPERMEPSSPFSLSIAQVFLAACTHTA